jgi:hypothetical protein
VVPAELLISGRNRDLRTAFAPWLLGLLLVLPVAGLARAGDDPREIGLRGDLFALERLLHDLDGGRATLGTLAGRVWDLHQRLAALEAGLGLSGAVVSRRSDWNAVALDVTRLGRRLRAVLVAKAERAHPATDGPTAGAFVPKPFDPAAPAPPLLAPTPPWPRKLHFNATAKLNYEPFGTRYIGTGYVGGWEDDFLQEGTRGTISFSLRARGLLKQMVSAKLRVVVRLLPPFAPTGGGFRVYDIEWKAERALSDNALRSWLEHETLTVHGPYRWIARPKAVSTSLDIEAHVLSLTHAKGETITFEAPEFVAR